MPPTRPSAPRSPSTRASRASSPSSMAGSSAAPPSTRPTPPRTATLRPPPRGPSFGWSRWIPPSVVVASHARSSRNAFGARGRSVPPHSASIRRGACAPRGSCTSGWDSSATPSTTFNYRAPSWSRGTCCDWTSPPLHPSPDQMTVRLQRVRSALALCLIVLAVSALPSLSHAQQGNGQLGDVVDAGDDFRKPLQPVFVASKLTAFDATTGRGTLQWDRYTLGPGHSFEKTDVVYSRAQPTEFPGTEYDRDPVLPFEISFVSPRTLRLRLSTRDLPAAMMHGERSLMLAGPVPTDRSWRVENGDSAVSYTSAFGRVVIRRNPWDVAVYDATGRLLTRTTHLSDPASYLPYTPFAFVRRARDLGRTTAAAFELAPDEGIYGFGESFTRLNK